jgi:alkanesulfonate monooxygenase SsuD/methylene tetrahydromethanopterin reductase-like flavin-dependent oxidoreductase (luciferase family)
MKTGIYLDLRNPPDWHRPWSRLYGFTLELCEEAEHLGVDSIWLSEHHLFDDGYLPQPLTFAAAVATRTHRVTIGTAVLIAPIRRAIHIAEEVAVVDAISGGRIELGLGAGYRVPEYEAYGADIRRRYDDTDECVRTLRAIWREGRVLPAPTQDDIPIWLGYNGPRGARRAGLLGEGLLTLSPHLYDNYVAGLVAGGYSADSARMSGVINAFVTRDPDHDWPVVAKHHAYQWDSYRRHMVEGTGQEIPRPVDPDRSRTSGPFERLDSLLYGSPEDVADAIIDHTSELPVETVFTWASPGAMGEAATVKHVQTICNELAPLLRL